MSRVHLPGGGICLCFMRLQLCRGHEKEQVVSSSPLQTSSSDIILKKDILPLKYFI